MAKELIKRVPIKEEWVYIADHYVDLGKIVHVWIDENDKAVQFHFIGGEKVAFARTVWADKEGYADWPSFEDPIYLADKEIDVLFDFIKQRFGGKELKEE